MKRQKIKNIIFDFGGVICDLHVQRCIEEFMRIGCKPTFFPKQFSQFEGVFQEYDRGTIDTKQFFDGIRLQANIPDATDEQIGQAWLSVLGNIPDERFAAMKDLRDSGYSLYILSNANELHWEYLDKNRMYYNGEHTTEWFRRVFLSYELHLEKPEPEIFQAVLDSADIKAEETLFIDDSQLNVDAASALGIHAFQSVDGDWVDRIETYVAGCK